MTTERLQMANFLADRIKKLDEALKLFYFEDGQSRNPAIIIEYDEDDCDRCRCQSKALNNLGIDPTTYTLIKEQIQAAKDLALKQFSEL